MGSGTLQGSAEPPHGCSRCLMCGCISEKHSSVSTRNRTRGRSMLADAHSHPSCINASCASCMCHLHSRQHTRCSQGSLKASWPSWMGDCLHMPWQGIPKGAAPWFHRVLAGGVRKIGLVPARLTLCLCEHCSVPCRQTLGAREQHLMSRTHMRCRQNANQSV
jgi:hypothetical protein